MSKLAIHSAEPIGRFLRRPEERSVRHQNMIPIEILASREDLKLAPKGYLKEAVKSPKTNAKRRSTETILTRKGRRTPI